MSEHTYDETERIIYDEVWKSMLGNEELRYVRSRLSIHGLRLIIRAAVGAAMRPASNDLRARVAELETELSDAVHALNAALSRGDRHGHRVAELESENAQHLAEIGRLHADILKLRGWEATPDGMREKPAALSK